MSSITLYPITAKIMPVTHGFLVRPHPPWQPIRKL
jgi:hypothetical protein